MAKKKPNSEEVKMGRPLITLKDLPEGWEDEILNLSRIGGSIVEIAVLLDISRKSLYNLLDRDDNFLHTINKCKRLCEAWWVKQGRVQLENKDFSSSLYYMNMKNRFGWKDKTETKVEGQVTQITTFKLPENDR